MAANTIFYALNRLAFYWFALFNYCLYIYLFIRSGAIFRRDTQRDKDAYAIEKDRFWNLSKSPLPGFKHSFYTLRNNLKLHYITNRDGPSQGSLVVFLHGFPDSSMMWRHLFQEKALPLDTATLVAVDLPGYGGSDSFSKYDTEVLEALTEFIIAMRDKYIPPDEADTTNTFVVGHDWGCVLGFRLAAEAPVIADRFILTNAPHIELAFANKDRILQSASKIFKQFRQSPIRNWACLSKSFKTLKPLLTQMLLMGYIFVFNLPMAMVKFLGSGFGEAFIRGGNMLAYDRRSKEYRPQESLASTFGPGPEECTTSIAGSSNGAESYGPSVLERAKSHGTAFWNMTGYYRDGAGSQFWTKSLETIADLYALETSASESSSPGRRRSSVVNGTLFTDRYKGSLKAPSFILWGEKDQACGKPVCLDGLGDYLAKDSEITLLPRTGHWTPVQAESRAALARVIELYAGKDAKPISKMTDEVQKVYAGAVQYAKR